MAFRTSAANLPSRSQLLAPAVLDTINKRRPGYAARKASNRFYTLSTRSITTRRTRGQKASNQICKGQTKIDKWIGWHIYLVGIVHLTLVWVSEAIVLVEHDGPDINGSPLLRKELV